MEELRDCAAPAKLNLFLHVVGRRADGYHCIESVFQLIDLADTLHFKRRADGHILRTTLIDGVPEETDLCVRAARLLQTETGSTFGVEIAIEKRIPMGGGLGGGSSDAATTLLALNRLWELKLSRAELQRIGLKLGADVPFFLFGHNAFVRGIGEQMQALDTPSRCFAVIHPGVLVPTAAIFSAPELTRSTESLKISDFSANGLQFSQLDLESFRNDLEPVAVARFPEVGKALAWLNRFRDQDQKQSARMSGSGACVFVPVPERSYGERLLRDLPDTWSGWVCQSLQKHPMREFAED